MNAWREIHDLALQVADGREAVRLANLSLAAAVASDEPLDAGRLRESVALLAVAGPVDCDENIMAWQALADAVGLAAPHLRGPDGHDSWVTSFQAADEARKSRGAYATPRALANPMARLLLRGRQEAPERIVDPSAGGGGLLVAMLRSLVGRRAKQDELADAVRRLHGVELDPVARELCCLQLWLACRGAENVHAIAARIHCDNAITRNWRADGPYDALIMNPPWESLRHTLAADDQRRRTIDRIDEPAESFNGALPPLFSCQGRGDRNLYKAFVELAPHLVRENGAIVALLPGAWSSDLGTQLLRDLYLNNTVVEQWTSFENRRRYFPIDGRYKFGILRARLDADGTRALRTLGMADDVRQLRARHVRVTAPRMRAIGGPSRLIPDLATHAEAILLAKVAAHGIPFFDNRALGKVAYSRELDLTQDRKRGLFHRFEDIDAKLVEPGCWIDADGRELRPLIEGRMVGQYDFFEKSWICGSGRTAQWSYNNGHGLVECTPQFLAPSASVRRWRIAICDVTSATNTRTVHAAWVPADWPCGNTAPVLTFESETTALAALAILNSMVFDWQARRIVSGLHLNRFYLEAMSWPDLTKGQVDELAERAFELLSLNRRFGDVAATESVRDPAQVDYVDAHVAIEKAVATGYRLTGADLEAMLSPDSSDRRGFWRAYATDPHALTVTERVLEDRLVTLHG